LADLQQARNYDQFLGSNCDSFFFDAQPGHLFLKLCGREEALFPLL